MEVDVKRPGWLSGGLQTTLAVSIGSIKHPFSRWAQIKSAIESDFLKRGSTA